ncbi:MAG: transposase [Verrucomicrobiaceae bacterium]|nr:MAG: transposase [Verrucomicrobiaceae bacterium]
MSQSLSIVYLHVTFSTKERVPFLKQREFRSELHAYVGAISRQIDCPPVIVGGVEDHIHVLVRFSRTISQADWVKEVKRASSLWIKSRDSSVRDFAWQSGYGAFSVSVSNLEAVRVYIEKQEEHHRRMTFQDEYRALLRKHGCAWDERHVWA